MSISSPTSPVELVRRPLGGVQVLDHLGVRGVVTDNAAAGQLEVRKDHRQWRPHVVRRHGEEVVPHPNGLVRLVQQPGIVDRGRRSSGELLDQRQVGIGEPVQGG